MEYNDLRGADHPSQRSAMSYRYYVVDGEFGMKCSPAAGD
jgi:hypothetical protein